MTRSGQPHPRLSAIPAAALFAAALSAQYAIADSAALQTAAATTSKNERADRAAPRRDANSMAAHAQLLEKAKQGRIDVYFIGDSIVRRWGALDYPELLANWRQNFHGWNAANFGWGGDRTQHILWRLENGELDGVNPKVIVVLAGTNNVGTQPRDEGAIVEIARGVKGIVDVCRLKAPNATIILTGIFPRNDNVAVLPTIDRINQTVATFADGRRVRFLNINERLAGANGVLIDGVMHDKLHPTVKGYQIWADALKPMFHELLGPPAATDMAPPPTGDPAAAARAQEMSVNALAARVDPYVHKQRVIVMTDIANEPDDQMSMVRFLVYSNHFDVEGLIATTSTWMKNKVRPDVIQTLVRAYGEVRPKLSQHQSGFPETDALSAVIAPGQPGYGMAAVGPGKLSPGAELILEAAERQDPRPLWALAWGGSNTLAQALLHAKTTKTAAQLDALVTKLRVYAISDQDDAGPWLRREFPALHYIGMPSTPDGDQYYLATWTGISGDRFYKNAPGADFTTFTDEWVDANIRSKGPLGKLYPMPCCIHEGDTPAFLGLIDNGLASFMSPTYGGWGGRYVWRTYYGETRPSWTQGGDSYPGRDNSRDTVTGVDGQTYTSDQATIWRWRTAFQNDFAARMDWTVKDVRDANHNPEVVVNGVAGRAPVHINATVGTPLTLDAAGTTDPDGNALRYRWFTYSEAGAGIPGRPVASSRPAPIGGGGAPGEGGIPSGPAGGPRQPPPRALLAGEATPRVTVTPRVARTLHVILAVEDDGRPSLTAYRRIILTIAK